MSDFLNVDVDGLLIGPCEPVRVMSVINLSPESFYKGSVADSIDKFHEMIETASREGADIIDIGGASTAPKKVYGTSDISVEEEIKRVSQALDSIKRSEYPPLSIDTTSSEVAEVALDLDVSMVNDISGLHADSKMASLVADRDVPIVLMANFDTQCESIQTLLNSLKDSLDIAREAGIESGRIILDPGIGFGKPPGVDIAILQELNRFVKLGHPLLVGVSRKAFIGHILDQPDPNDRLIGSMVATTIAVMKGASVIRTHDVGETKVAVQMGEALRTSQ
ncbi:MAG: dihydropteroate synthase [Candidatus Thorarchaeota archaeon]